MSSVNNDDLSENLNRPNPAELDKYLPWACAQLGCPLIVFVTKITQAEYVSVMPTAKKAKSKAIQAITSSSSQALRRDDVMASRLSEQETLNVYAVHDSMDRLVELKFDKNDEIPRLVFQILKLIIKFQNNLTTLTINRGIDKYSLYEINKFLPICNITDINLDNTFLKEANYYVLLDNCTSIKRLSIARCRITDEVVDMIAARLIYPLPASKTLVILDLSTNRITDEGAKHIANALRSNRCLSYLNLSGNCLTDDGAETIFNTLVEFVLTQDEIVESRKRLIEFYKQKNELAMKLLKDLRLNDDKATNRRKSLKTPTSSKRSKGLERDNSAKEVKSLLSLDMILYEKACNMAENKMGDFKDPYSKSNLVKKDDNIYCLGNNTLCYLNLSFNNLSYPMLRKLLNVVTVQKLNNKPIGLLNVCIDGNLLPMTCIELVQIDNMLQSTYNNDKNKKRAITKSSPSVR